MNRFLHAVAAPENPVAAEYNLFRPAMQFSFNVIQAGLVENQSSGTGNQKTGMGQIRPGGLRSYRYPFEMVTLELSSDLREV